ncbi:MAG TPA: hypothetical protein VM165_16410 [Planctomycetaceae bacterium]|nr:hypothetical protein [Planctomycetaceae bacterium]
MSARQVCLSVVLCCLSTGCDDGRDQSVRQNQDAVNADKAETPPSLHHPRIVAIPDVVPLMETYEAVGKDQIPFDQPEVGYPAAWYVQGHIWGWYALLSRCQEDGLKDALAEAAEGRILTGQQSGGGPESLLITGFPRGAEECGKAIERLLVKHSEDAVKIMIQDALDAVDQIPAKP